MNHVHIVMAVIHLIGFHPLKEDPQQQMGARHYCRQMNDEFAQCALFDSDAADARLTGIEYLRATVWQVTDR